MCLFVTPGSVPLIAEEDITVYKVLLAPLCDNVIKYNIDGSKSSIKTSVYFSPFQSYPYELRRYYTSEFDYDLSEAPVVISNNIQYVEVNKGIHTFASHDEALYFSTLRATSVVIECVIRKGTRYFKGIWPNQNGRYIINLVESYASESLYIKGVMD